MEIKLTFSKQEILQRVKSKTHKKGTTDIADKGDKAVKYAYNEQAGDDENDTFLLLSALRTSLDKLKAFIGEFLQSDDTTAADNITDDLSSAEDTFNLTLIVSARFNKSMTQPLADLGSRFMEDDMCLAWYTPINANDAKIYAELLSTDELAISRCFLKVKPSVPVHSFPKDFTITSTTGGADSAVSFVKNVSSAVFSRDVDITTKSFPRAIGDELVIKYTLSKGSDGETPLDDIICSVNNQKGEVVIEDGIYVVYARHAGEFIITLYSKHNTELFYQAKINVVV